VSTAITCAAPATPCALHGAQPDRAEPEHCDDVAGRDPRADGRVVTGRHHVACEQRDVVGQAIGHRTQRQVGVRDERHVGLRAVEVAHRLAMAERTREVAAVVVGLAAEVAQAACRMERAQDAVAGLDVRDAVADRLDDADVLVADRRAGVHRVAPVVDVQVRTADAGCGDADDRVVGGYELGLGHVVEADLLGPLECHRSHRARNLKI
jgi:hypothetical protein